MPQEQNFELTSWWNEQTFHGKELFKADESGDLILLANNNIRERVIGKITDENCHVVLKNLIENFSAVESRVRELEVEWLAAEDKLKLAEKVGQLKEYLHQVTAVGDFLKPALLVHDWEHTIYTLTEENYTAKLKLAELAESIAESKEWKETSQAFREINDKWKQSGHLDKNRNDKLWNRIEAARKAFQERKRLHHEDEEKDMLTNLDLKMDLVEQAEAISKSGEWKKTSDAFTRLTEEWKKIGPTIHKKNEELWHRFIAAKSAFFERKREHSGKIQQEQENNYAVKLALVEKAEALRESRDWNTTSQAYAALMEEWKKTGRIPHEKGDELWKRFTEAQDHFFENRKTHFGSIKEVQENNFNLKKALLDRAERIKNSTSWTDTTNEMVELLEEWKKIGHIPRYYGDTMWEDFNAARKYFFARKDANREQRKQIFEEQREQRAELAKGLVGKLELEIKEEEDKIADFRNGLENITPGKKAQQLRTHLEKLIDEVADNIKRLQKKLEQAKNDLKVPGHEHSGKGNVPEQVINDQAAVREEPGNENIPEQVIDDQAAVQEEPGNENIPEQVIDDQAAVQEEPGNENIPEQVIDDQAAVQEEPGNENIPEQVIDDQAAVQEEPGKENIPEQVINDHAAVQEEPGNDNIPEQVINDQAAVQEEPPLGQV